MIETICFASSLAVIREWSSHTDGALEVHERAGAKAEKGDYV